MGKKGNPAVIGAFVVGAIALAVAGLLVFGSGRMFKHTSTFVLFFPGTVNGLNVGAPVKFKGVTVGSVTDIRLRFDLKKVAAEEVSKGVRIPVLIEIDRDKLAASRDIEDRAQLKELIDLGLRAQLNAESLVTGLLYVQLDFMPNQPATLRLPEGSKPPEIPTVPTQFEQVQSAAAEIIHKLEDLHFDTMIKSAAEVLDGVKNVVNTPELKQTVETLPATVANINQAVTSLRELTVRLDKQQVVVVDGIARAMNRADATLEQARLTLQTAQSFINPASPLAGELVAALQELSGAARSVRLLADFLERNPSAIVRGRDVKEK